MQIIVCLPGHFVLSFLCMKRLLSKRRIDDLAFLVDHIVLPSTLFTSSFLLVAPVSESSYRRFLSFHFFKSRPN